MSDETAYLLDLSAHGRIRATGEDRARLIHALSTNHIQQLQPGESAYAFFLTAQGRILADAHIVCFPDSLLIDTEPETREALHKHIDHYIIADDVTLEDETGQTFSFAIEGDGASAIPLHGLTVAAVSASGAPGRRIYGPVARKAETWQRLLEAGARESALHPLRLQHFHPRYGEDITEKTLPQETGLTQALHFQKGCYLGQEIVERIRSRGHVNRMLCGLKFEASAPAASTKVFSNETEVGEITSSAGNHAIAMLRIDQIKPSTRLHANSQPAVSHPISS